MVETRRRAEEASGVLDLEGGVLDQKDCSGGELAMEGGGGEGLGARWDRARDGSRVGVQCGPEAKKVVGPTQKGVTYKF